MFLFHEFQGSLASCGVLQDRPEPEPFKNTPPIATQISGGEYDDHGDAYMCVCVLNIYIYWLYYYSYYYPLINPHFQHTSSNMVHFPFLGLLTAVNSRYK